MADEILGDPPAHAKSWFARMLDYNVKGGKLNRGMAVYDTLQALKTVSVHGVTARLRGVTSASAGFSVIL